VKPATLIIGPSWIGDMMMAQALFQALKQEQPEHCIDVLAPAWSFPLLERMGEVRKAWPMPLGHGALGLKTRYEIGCSLREQHYSQALVLANSWKSALIPYFAHIPKRSGWLGECRFGLLNDWRYLNKNRYPRMVQRYVALAYPAGREEFEILQPRLKVKPEQVLQTLHKFGLHTETPILGLCPGAEFGSSKRWPESHYAALAREKINQGWQVWLLGSPKDSEVAFAIQKIAGECRNLAGHTSMGEVIDLLSATTAVVSNDSGLMHIAAALEKPVVAVYGSTDPNYTPPLGQDIAIVRQGSSCSPCFKRECPLEHHHCMQALEPKRVLAALDKLQLNNPSHACINS